MYLDFGGFNFTGGWGSSGQIPGATPAYSVDGDATTFSAGELSNIREVWARTAEAYSVFNVNVTTIDPAIAAGKAGSDVTRQAYYDTTAKMTHTVIGGLGGWYGSAGGASYTGTIGSAFSATPNSGASSGFHTNFVFSAAGPSFLQFVAQSAAHENGHSFGLSHQSDFGTGGVIDGLGTTLINEYSSNGGTTGNGSFAPTMGNGYYAQRSLWRTGNADVGNGWKATVNDVKTISANSGMTYVDDGIAHARAAASDLPLSSHTVVPATARGIIVPASLVNPVAIGADNYTRDYFRFFSTGTTVSLTCTDGSEYGAPGIADAGATLDSTLKIFNSAGTVVATGSRATNTLSETFAGSLPAGNYSVEIASVGGYTSLLDPTARYYTQGSYFLSGSGLSVRSALAGANLSGANLASQDLSNSNLTGASLRSTTLTGASLAAANLSLADLRGAVGYAPSGNTTVRGTIQPDGQLPGFAFASSAESLVISPSALPASAIGTITGPGTIAIAGSGKLVLGVPASTASYIRPITEATLAISGTSGAIGTVTTSILTATALMPRTLLPELSVLTSLSIANNAEPLGTRCYFGQWDLGTNDALVHNGSLADLADMARAFAATGHAGLGSLGTIPDTTIAVIANTSSMPGIPLRSTFDGYAAVTTDVLLKFTYIGDTDLNGVVDGADLANLLSGEFGSLSGWQNGDLNYDGLVDDTDLGLLMASLTAQGYSLGDMGGTSGSVPEPGLLALLTAPAGLLARRRPTNA